MLGTLGHKTGASVSGKFENLIDGICVEGKLTIIDKLRLKTFNKTHLELFIHFLYS